MSAEAWDRRRSHADADRPFPPPDAGLDIRIACREGEDTGTMSGFKSLTTIVCAAAVAIGLAACGGSGGSGPKTPAAEDIAAATARAVALAAAVEAAKATAAGGSFDDTAHMVAPSVEATHDGTTVTLVVSEGGTPRSGSARSGELVEEEEGPSAIAGWTGARFRRGEAGERLVVYSDVDAPEAMAFVPENLNRLREVSGLTGEAVPEAGLAVEVAYLSLIGSTSLAAASPNGSVTYGAQGTGAEEGLSFTGTFAGGTGSYSCTGAACSVTLDDRGMPTAMGGAWAFAPDSGAMVEVPDYAHLQFGWWLNARENGSYDFQTFAGSTGHGEGSGAVSASMTGTATYRGAAAGVYAVMDVAGGKVTGGRAGEFAADATLTAHFFGTLDAGEIGGEVGSFRTASGEAMAGWRVTLEAVGLRSGSATFAGATGGTVGPGTSGEGHWEGRFHGSDGAEANARPSGVTGRFDVHFPGAHIAGAFGASR